MSNFQGGTFTRTDMWREGKWLDLWSVVHLLSGASIGLGFYFLHFGTAVSTALVFVLLILYEVWEARVNIEEVLTNRCTDFVVGMVGYVLAFFILAPCLSPASLVYVFSGVLTVNIALSVLGWHASQKAAALKKRLRARFIKQKMQLQKRFRK